VKAKIALLVQLLLGSRLTDPQKLIALGRELAFSLGVTPNPVGMGNKKTGVPSTYRPVGLSCPPCPISPYCYARFGHTGLHQERAKMNPLSSIFSAVIALVSALKAGTVARLHVSGDFYTEGELDDEYVDGLLFSLRLLEDAKIDDISPLAWTYTQMPLESFSSIFGAFSEAGLTVLRSGYLGIGGSYIYPHQRLHYLRTANVQLVNCPAQTQGSNCKDCLLCPKAYELGICIVFDPHGVSRAGLEHEVLSSRLEQENSAEVLEVGLL